MLQILPGCHVIAFTYITSLNLFHLLYRSVLHYLPYFLFLLMVLQLNLFYLLYQIILEILQDDTDFYFSLMAPFKLISCTLHDCHSFLVVYNYQKGKTFSYIDHITIVHLVENFTRLVELSSNYLFIQLFTNYGNTIAFKIYEYGRICLNCV